MKSVWISVFLFIPCDLQKNTSTSNARLLGLGSRLLGLQDLNDDLLLLDEEGAQDALPQAAVAQDSSVGPADGLLALGHAWPLAGPARPDALQLVLALATLGHITALLHVLVDQAATGRANTERRNPISHCPGAHIPTPVGGGSPRGIPALTHGVCWSWCCTTDVVEGSIAEPFLGCKKQGKPS